MRYLTIYQIVVANSYVESDTVICPEFKVSDTITRKNFKTSSSMKLRFLTISLRFRSQLAAHTISGVRDTLKMAENFNFTGS